LCHRQPAIRPPPYSGLNSSGNSRIGHLVSRLAHPIVCSLGVEGTRWVRWFRLAVRLGQTPFDLRQKMPAQGLHCREIRRPYPAFRFPGKGARAVLDYGWRLAIHARPGGAVAGGSFFLCDSRRACAPRLRRRFADSAHSRAAWRASGGWKTGRMPTIDLIVSNSMTQYLTPPSSIASRPVSHRLLAPGRHPP